MDSQNNSSAKIGRTFSDIPEKIAEGSEQASLYKSPGFGWDVLLKSPRVLIVSEAGTGKTFECRQQQKTLWAEGKAAFYVELSALASTSLPDLLSGEESKRFRAWLDSQADVATFFLDSIDELKLTRGSFEAALKRLNHTVYSHLNHIHIAITTRPTPFDRHLILQYLPIPPKPAATPGVEDFADEVMHKKRLSGSGFYHPIGAMSRLNRLPVY